MILPLNRFAVQSGWPFGWNKTVNSLSLLPPTSSLLPSLLPLPSFLPSPKPTSSALALFQSVDF